MDHFPFDGEGILRIADAKACGIDPRQIYQAERDQRLVRVMPGVYVLPVERRPEQRHRLRVLAAQLPPATVVSHSSAAVVHGLGMLRPDLDQLHLTSVRGAAGYRRKMRYLHPGRLGEDDIVEVDGVPVTSKERTAFDVARSSRWGFAGALSVFDSALRAKADRAVMEQFCLSRQAGVGVARRALALADARAENPGESWSRAQMIQAGISSPRLQTDVFDRHGTFLARPDFDWIDEAGAIKLVGEFDGLGKYLDYLRPGETAEDVIRREKEREGRLRDMEILVVRWTWKDLMARAVAALVSKNLRLVGLV
ncbi:hypothetical protein GOARA_088_00720 [Gordonia araii NBRC 100433]|uniref:AbiEi antitoxin N-terminal domain-containing protein n=1 Tax=Gordonia araii NBRC 100433 TaxID=1073574 RepID=G7H7I3_9ACTN|nr:type IV toxin-antitoxin system AbiEi family antitoxin domain-containing protein [Gordonia araii]NNG98491.1 hypothetical protein [Gordonia araii NBRC 100433]GAB11808.1 hypothetical protein GOARA_088_00720 [Gordonia araii NBRC 100433]